MPQIIEHLESRHRRARRAADPHGPLGRRRVHADPARPRLRRRRAWRSTRRRPRASSGCRCRRSRRPSRCSRTPPTATAPSASRTSSGTTRSPTAFSEEESRALYERYHVPASGRDLLGQRAGQRPPRPQDDSYVNYKNDDRAPLLFISGSEDHLMPPSLQRSNAKHYKSEHTLTEVKEFEGPHLLPAQEGWEEVADYALDWALEHARRERRRAHDRRPHHPHRRADDADRGGWLAAADRPDVRPRRRGSTASAGGRGRASWPGRRSPPRTSAGSTRSCSRTTTTTTTSTPPGARCSRRRASSSRRWRARSASAARRAGCEDWATHAARGARAGRRSRSPRRRAATGRRGSHPIVGDVIGFALRWEGQKHGVLWISGDTVLYDGVREVATGWQVGHRAAAPRRRAVPDHRPAALHDDRATTRSSCAALVRPRTAIPIHYEGWKHFRQGRDAVEREFAAAPADVRERVRWLPIGPDRLGG